jgi:hypothetical protein
MVGGEPWGRLGQDQEHIGKEGHGIRSRQIF